MLAFSQHLSLSSAHIPWLDGHYCLICLLALSASPQRGGTHMEAITQWQEKHQLMHPFKQPCRKPWKKNPNNNNTGLLLGDPTSSSPLYRLSWLHSLGYVIDRPIDWVLSSKRY